MRLVNRSFYAISNEFLINDLEISSDRKQIEKFKNVCHHEALRHYVRELEVDNTIMPPIQPFDE